VVTGRESFVVQPFQGRVGAHQLADAC